MELTRLRNEIDLVDTEIIILLQKRFEVIDRIAEYKKLNSIEVVQSWRWQELLEERKKLASKLDLDENMIEEIWNIIHKYAILEEKEIINN